MIDQFSQYGYMGVFAAIIATGFGLPLPEELPILTAGVLVGHGDTLPPNAMALDPARLRWWVMLPVCILAVVVGDGLLYAVGRIWGPMLLSKKWVQEKILTAEKRALIEKNFQDRGIMILLTARLTPGIRTPIFLMAGVLRVPMTRFLIADGLYAIPGVNVMFWLAYFLTDQVLEVFHKIHQYRPLVIVAILSAVAGAVLYRLFFNRNVTTGSSIDVPTLAKPVEKVEQAIMGALDAVTHMGHHADKSVKPPLPVPEKPGLDATKST